MPGRRIKFIVALLSIGFVQAGALAACTAPANLKAAQNHCRHMPCPRRSCCAPDVAVQAAMPESQPRWERPLVATHIAALPARAYTLEPTTAIEPCDPKPAAWRPDDSLVRIHVLRI